MNDPRSAPDGVPTVVPAAPDGIPVDDGLPALPPDEKFWRRHSPHHEFPLSLAATVLSHMLLLFAAVIVGSMLLGKWGCSSNATQPVPIDSLDVDYGGSGGNPEGDDSNTKPTLEVKERQPDVPPVPQPVDTPKPVVQQTPSTEVVVDPNAPKVEETQSTSAADLDQALEQAIASKGPKGSGGEGQGGSGGGPGKGNARTARMVRWVMQFSYDSPRDYLRQMRLLGAKIGLAKPGSNKVVLVADDLSVLPAQLKEVTVRSINQIFWRDNNQQAVVGICQLLGVTPPNPLKFYAFMPQSVEEELLEKEMAFGKRFGRTKESDIAETVFDVEFVGQTPKFIVREQHGFKEKPGKAPPRGRRR